LQEHSDDRPYLPVVLSLSRLGLISDVRRNTSSSRRRFLRSVLLVGLAACQVADPGNDPDEDPGALQHENVLIDLWADGTAAFGIFVPNERPLTDEQRRSGEQPVPVYTSEGGERLARNPLYDFLFLDLEGRYDVAAVAAIAEGLRSPSAVGQKTLLVRVPPIERDGEDDVTP